MNHKEHREHKALPLLSLCSLRFIPSQGHKGWDGSGTPGRRPADRSDAAAFTRLDLLAVTVVLGLLALLLMPAFAADRSSSETFQCMNNLRRLTTGWVAYADDHNGMLVPTAGLNLLVIDPNDPRAEYGGTHAQWVLGLAQYTDLEFVRRGLLFPYVKSVDDYKCPADRSQNTRSVSMNAWMNPVSTEGSLNPASTIFRKMTDVQKPSATWVLTEENPNSINDGWFVARPDRPQVWYGIPASDHHGAAALSFADTHVEVKRWTDRSVLWREALAPARRDLASDDLPWLLERTTY